MKAVLKVSIVVFTVLFGAKLLAVEPYKNTSLSVDERVEDLISRMTLSEKISQLGNRSAEIEHLGVQAYNYWNEGIHGVARSGLATSFPVSIALSSTWNPELVYEIATATSDEARIKNNTEGKGLTYWSPTVNMARDPRWGRSEENYGEDVYLSSQIAVNFIKGMQGSDPHYLKTVATVKHFAGNNVEKNRYGISSDIDEQNLRDYYLPVFKACVTDARVYSVMSAYNAVNNVPCPANRKLLTNILRKEWGFKGFVVSDCDAVGNVFDPHAYVGTAAEAAAIALQNGNDLNCGTTSPENADSAITAGILSEDDIDTALKHIFKARFLLGEFDPPSKVPYTSIPDSLLFCKKHCDLALQAAQESLVLLKNENSFLPLNNDEISKIAVIGPNANAVQLGGYSGSPKISVSALQGIANKLGVDISTGRIEAEFFSAQKGIKAEECEEGGNNVGFIEDGDYAVYDKVDFKEGKTKVDIRIANPVDSGSIEFVLDQINGPVLGKFAIPKTGGWQSWQTVTFDLPQTSGIHRLYLKFSGQSGYLFNLNWFRFYNDDDPDPTDGRGRMAYAEGCTVTGEYDQTEIDKAVAMAKISDVAVVVCGTDLSVSDEGHDRNSLGLPGAQLKLLQAVYKANPKTILVLATGVALAVNWAQENVPGIICSWYNGQDQGTALADVLFGDYNPAGRLSTTWYKCTDDLPPMDDYDVKNNRTYMYYEGKPLYPFGFGLSYSNFSYSNLSFSNNYLAKGDSIIVSADVTNTGELAGDEVVQCYVHVNSLDEIRPKQQLKGFERIHLLPGETKTVHMKLKHEDLQFYDSKTRTFVVDEGNIEVYVGASSDDIRLDGQIKTEAGTISSTYRQNPFSQTEAETFENKSEKVKIAAGPDKVLSAQLAGNDSYIVFKNMDFNQPGSYFTSQLSSFGEGAQLSVLLDGLDGQLVGTIDLDAARDEDAFSVQGCSIGEINGVHDLYLVLKGSASVSCKLNWFRFQEKAKTIN